MRPAFLGLHIAALAAISAAFAGQQPQHPKDFKPFHYRYTTQELRNRFSRRVMQRNAGEMARVHRINQKDRYQPTWESLDRHPPRVIAHSCQSRWSLKRIVQPRPQIAIEEQLLPDQRRSWRIWRSHAKPFWENSGPSLRVGARASRPDGGEVSEIEGLVARVAGDSAWPLGRGEQSAAGVLEPTSGLAPAAQGGADPANAVCNTSGGKARDRRRLSI